MDGVLYNSIIEKVDLEEVVERVLTWPQEDQEKFLRFVDALEELGAQEQSDIE